MALFGGSSSESSPSSAGTQVQDEGFGFSLSGKFKNSDLTVVQSDHESISAAFSFADRSIGDSLALVDNAVGDALMFAEMVNDDIIQTVNDSRDSALEFGAGAFMEASETSRQAVDAAARASEASSYASRAAIDSAQDAFDDSLFAVGSMADSAFNLTRDGYNSALSAVGGAFGSSIESITNTTGLAIETATNSTRSEASQSFDQLVKIAAGAAVGIVALYVLLGK